jgi:methylglutaconyl-CoA hydratase
MIEFQIDGRGVARLTLNRPEVRNAFNAALIAEITNAVSSLPPEARVLVLGGEGKVFCAGADLEWMRSMAGFSREENVADSGALEKMFAALDSCPVPVVGRIHGAAMAGATGLVACCDVAIASEGTIFAFTETKLGLVPAVISPYVIRRVGYAFARAAFLTAERFDAKRAYEAGLVHAVVPENQLDEAVERTVGDFLQAAPGALVKTRRLLEEVWGHKPSEVAELTVSTIAEVRAGEEAQEGMAAFFEKRKPRWAPE